MLSHKCVLRLSRNYVSWFKSHKKPPGLSTKFCEDFTDFYPKLVDKTIANYKYMKHLLPRDLCKKMAEYYTLDRSKPLQGQLLMHAYELLEDPKKMSDEKVHQAYVLGCAIEAVQSCFMIDDDIMDKCETRGDKAAWHVMPEAGPMCINDTHVLKNLIREMLRQNMDKSIYAQAMDILNEMFFTTEIGQYMDYRLPLQKDFSAYTIENYDKIAQLKTSFYAMNAPIQYSLVLSDKANEETFRLVGDVCNDLGVFIQINNDFAEYLDYDSKDASKSRSIVNGKCSWPAVTALQKLNAEQAKTFKECYGSSDTNKLNSVKQIYDEINLKELYKQEMDKRCDTFLRKVKNLPNNSVPSIEFFLKTLEFFKSEMTNSPKL